METNHSAAAPRQPRPVRRNIMRVECCGQLAELPPGYQHGFMKCWGPFSKRAPEGPKRQPRRPSPMKATLR